MFFLITRELEKVPIKCLCSFSKVSMCYVGLYFPPFCYKLIIFFGKAYFFILKVLIVFTDGRSKSGVTSVKAAAERLKDVGVNMISVGVGSRISTAELHAMASQPTSKHVFRVPTPSLLSSIVSRVKTVSCAGKKRFF